MSDDDSDAMSDDEWKPGVLFRWAALLSEEGRDGKRYTAFLRYVFKRYNIKAQVCIRWVKSKRGGSKHQQLKVTCLSRTKTMDEMREDMAELREVIMRFDPEKCNVAAPPVMSIHYNPMNIWEKNPMYGRDYFRDLMSVGKGSVPYLSRDIREIIRAP